MMPEITNKTSWRNVISIEHMLLLLLFLASFDIKRKEEFYTA